MKLSPEFQIWGNRRTMTPFPLQMCFTLASLYSTLFVMTGEGVRQLENGQT
jgi:hypothetical protein